ncbi:Uncharacterized protein SCG7109_AA_00490 [Chlamydiales bacterium SCGC AG-110-M15]|nr:Uncharacterized protein SCG7109_AA_00490 [Chlamydiales bacterium SCGC AG-110-M15]
MLSYRFLSLLIFISFSNSVSADNKEASGMDLLSAPSAFVNGSVNTISGTYCESHTDFIVPGPTPIQVTRTYSTGVRHTSLSGGWSSGQLCYLQSYRAQNIEATRRGRNPPIPGTIIAENAMGAALVYFTKDTRLSANMEMHVPAHVRGLTNCTGGEISGRTNCKNSRVDEERGDCSIIAADGSRRVYETIESRLNKSRPGERQLVKEEQTNGNTLEYSYNEMRNLTKIVSKAKGSEKEQTYLKHQANFSQNPKSYEVKGSNGRWAQYFLGESPLAHKGTVTLARPIKKVVSSDGPTVHYTYDEKRSMNSGKLLRVDYPNDRYLINEYYDNYDDHLGERKIDRIHKWTDPRIGRVKRQLAPVGTTNEPVEIYNYEYFVKNLSEDVNQAQLPGAGRTDVRDAYQNLTRYHFTELQRLDKVEHFQKKNKEDQLNHIEKMLWGKITGPDATNLLAHITLNENYDAVFSKTYTYDKSGNVSVESIWGNLSGKGKETFEFDETGKPIDKEIEGYHVYSTYSNDDYHVTLSRTEDNGHRTDWVYRENSDVLLAKYESCHGMRYSREFYTYNAAGSLIKTVTDDGSDDSVYHLNNVTMRHITCVTPSDEPVSFGLPLIIEERFLNLETQEQELISKVVNTYNNLGRLVKQDFFNADNEYGYSNKTEYDGKGRPIKLEDTRGEIYISAYDENGNKVFTQGPGTEKYTTYQYDFADRLIQKTEKHRDGKTFSEAYAYDYLGRRVSSRDIYGNTSYLEYDTFGRETRVRLASISSENGLATPEVQKEYDFLGNCIASTDADGRTEHFAYSVRGDTSRKINVDSTTEEYVYNLDGTLKTHTDIYGTVTENEYDYQGRLICAKQYSAKGQFHSETLNIYDRNHLVQTIDPEGNVSTFQYDNAGRLAAETKGYERKEYAYDSWGRQKAVRVYTGIDDEYIEERKEYDAFNRVILESSYTHLGILQSRQAFTYDIHGRCIEEHKHGQAGTGIWTKEYDAHGDLVQLIDALGNKTKILYDHHHVNEHGQKVLLKMIVDPEGHVTHKEMDTLGREVKSSKFSYTGILLDQQDIHYSLSGKKLEHVHIVFSEGKELKKVTTKWEYRLDGKLERLISGWGSPDQKLSQEFYDTKGSLITHRNADGSEIHYVYDVFGKMVERVSSDGTVHERYSYDLCGRVTSIENLVMGTETKKVYDVCGRVIEEMQENALMTSYRYDALGRCVAMTLPDSSEVQYVYEGNHLKAVKRLNALGKEQYQHQYLKYDLAGRRTYARLPLGVGDVEYAYDLNGRQVNFKSDYLNWTIPEDGGFDRKGNLLKIDVHDAMGEVQGAYAYNSLHQLKSEKGMSTHQYRYDSRDNRLEKDKLAYSNNVVDQLLKAGDKNYENDERGNRISESSVEGDKKYTYDALNRLTRVSADDWEAVYTYDYASRRMSRKLEYGDGRSEEELYLYHDKREIGSLDANGNYQTLRVLGLGLGAEIGAAVAVELGGSVYVPVHDHRSSVGGLVDVETGKVLESYRYSAYGEEEIYDGAGEKLGRSVLGNPWRFSSKRTDVETGLVYFGERYYDPEEGRWISADPLGFEAGPNVYAYVFNSPLAFHDQYGLSAQKSEQAESKTKGRSRFWSNLKKAPGRLLEGIGKHALVNPVYKNLYQRTGQFLKGGSFFEAPQFIKDLAYCAQIGYTERVGTGSLTKKESLMFIPGQGVSVEDGLSHAYMISKYFGGQGVDLIHNPSQGLAADTGRSVGHHTTRIINGRLRVISDDPLVRDGPVVAATKRMILQRAQELGDGGRLRIIVHSQGGLVLMNALMDLDLSKYSKVNFDIDSFGSAFMIPSNCGDNVRNFVSLHDPIPMLSDPAGLLFRNKNVTFLEPSKESYFMLDHGFQNSCYRDVVKWEGQDFIDTYGKVK